MNQLKSLIEKVPFFRINNNKKPAADLLQRASTTSLQRLAAKFPPSTRVYPLHSSPAKDLQEYYKRIINYSSCEVCLLDNNVLPKEKWNDINMIEGGTSRSEPAPKSVNPPTHTCDQCGFPVLCDEHKHFEHSEDVCRLLKEYNADEHDIRSGRPMWEMNLPLRQHKDSVLNFSSWPYIFVTRKFTADKALFNSSTAQRHLSRVLTYPYTICSMLYNPWVYAYHSASTDSTPLVTDAGWHLLSSLSHAVDVGVKSSMIDFHPTRGPKRKITFTTEPTAPTLTSDPFRIFILGPRVECQLPVNVWEQISLTFPGVPFRVYFIGPECEYPTVQISTNISSNPYHMEKNPRVVPATRIHKKPVTSRITKEESEQQINSMVIPVTVNLRLEYLKTKYENVHDSFGPFNPTRDLFVCFNSGVGHYVSRDSWKSAIREVLKTKCMLIFTSMNKKDQEADVKAVKEDYDGDYEVVLRATNNKFSSMRPDIAADCVNDVNEWVYCNWGIFAIRGVGTDVGESREDFYIEERHKKGIFGW